MSLLVQVLREIFKALLVALVTEKFIKEVIIYSLEKLAKKTDNEVDDELVAIVKKALEAPKEEPAK